MTIPAHMLPRLHEDIIHAGVAIVSVNAEGIVQPPELQAAAQPTIDAFDQSPAAQQAWAGSKSIGQSFPKRLGALRTNSTSTFADVDGLEWQLVANAHYIFDFAGYYSADTAATGITLSINGPPSPVLFRMGGMIVTSQTTAAYGAIAAYDDPIAGASSGGATPAPFWLSGNISTGAAGGKLVLRFRSETTGQAVNILAGSRGTISPVS